MLPLLCHLQDGRERSNQETLEALAREFGLTEQEREELLPSGRQPVFTNRVAWANVHLKAARLIESPRRGVYKIAARGLEILKQKPERVDLRLLRTFPEYQEWRTPRPDEEEDIEKGEDALTPEEHLEYGYQKLREDLASDLVRRVREACPAFFGVTLVQLSLDFYMLETKPEQLIGDRAYDSDRLDGALQEQGAGGGAP
jgi:restriction system protein